MIHQNWPGKHSVYFYIFAIWIRISGTGVVLPALIEVWKTPLKASHGIHQDVFPVTEPSSHYDLCPVVDGTGITREE